MSYVIISPCRDEAQYMVRTLDSVARQTVTPDLWIVVDDGSTDDSPRILAEYARRLPYLRVVRRDDRGRRSVGPGVVEAFYAGYRSIDGDRFEYLCKLDLDLELPRRYFEMLIARMDAEPRLGSCSGKPYAPRGDGVPAIERSGDEMSAGMTKFYRTRCFREIGGLVPHVMWDGIDCHRCRMLGWSAKSFDDPELRFLHLRQMGSSEGGVWRGRWRHGTGQWFMGTSLSYMTASALYRTLEPPLVAGGLAMWLGYVTSMLQRKPRFDEPEFRAFVRRYQRESLLFGKRRATSRVEQRVAAHAHR